MTREELRSDVRNVASFLAWAVGIFVALVLAVALIGGIAVGCQASLKANSRANVVRVHNDEIVAFYKLCQRRFAIGQVDPRCVP